MRGGIDPIYAELNRSILDKGAPRKPKFRKPEKVTNRILYAILLVRDMKVIEFSEAVGVQSTTAAAWLFRGEKPKPQARRRISDLLGFPEDILFHEIVRDGVEITIPEEGKFYWRVIRNSPCRNIILAGLFAVHNLPFEKTCKYMGVYPTMMRRYIHNGQMPTNDTLAKIETFFQLPGHILFASNYFCDHK